MHPAKNGPTETQEEEEVLDLLVLKVLQGLLASPLQPVGPSRHDFGVVLIDGKDQTVEHTFLPRNTTDRPLQIIKTVPSCGCTWAGPGEPNLAPGATMELPVTLTVKESHKIDSNIKANIALGGHRSGMTRIKYNYIENSKSEGIFVAEGEQTLIIEDN